MCPYEVTFGILEYRVAFALSTLQGRNNISTSSVDGAKLSDT